MKTWAICVASILGASWAFGGAGGRSITLDINQQDRAFSNTVARGEAFDWEVYLTRGGAAYTNETITGGGVYYSTSRTASAWVVFPFSSWSASGGRVVCRMAATNSMGLSTNSADYPIGYDASIILTTSNNVYRWRQGVLTITDDGSISGSTAAAVSSGMVPSTRTLTINGVGYDLSSNRSWTVTAAAPSNTAWSTVTGTPTTVSGYGITDAATAAQGIAATNAQARVAIVETNAVLRGDTNAWVVSSHASFLTAESDPIFATNGAPRSWVAGFSNAPATWNEDERTIDVSFPDGTTGQLFEEIWIPIRNTSGTTITNGKVVRACSANGYYSGAELASSTGTFDQVTDVMGIATETITNGGVGKITIIGNVNQLDTTALEEGSNLWLSATAGEVTMIRPTTSANKQVLIGRCLRSNVNQGRIEVAIQVIPWPVDIGAVASSDTNGWVVSSHSDFVTNGQKIAAATNTDYATVSGTASNLVGAQSNALAMAVTTNLTEYFGAPFVWTNLVMNTSNLTLTPVFSTTNTIRYRTASTGAVTIAPTGWPADRYAEMIISLSCASNCNFILPTNAPRFANGTWTYAAPSIRTNALLFFVHTPHEYWYMAGTNDPPIGTP